MDIPNNYLLKKFQNQEKPSNAICLNDTEYPVKISIHSNDIFNIKITSTLFYHFDNNFLVKTNSLWEEKNLIYSFDIYFKTEEDLNLFLILSK